MGEIIKITCYTRAGMIRQIARLGVESGAFRYTVKMYELRPFLVLFRIHTAVLVRTEAAYHLRKKTGPVTEKEKTCL